MPKLTDSLKDWRTDTFPRTLTREIQGLKPGTLPLRQGSSRGGHVDDSHLEAVVLSLAADEHAIQAKVGIFFDEIIAGCSCGEEPVPQTGYCELRVSIDKSTAEADFAVISD